MLSITDLYVRYEDGENIVRAVNDVSFKIDQGENLGIIGESGCGKTTMAKSILRLLPSSGKITGGRMDFITQTGEECNLMKMPKKKFNRKIRWNEISYIPQSAMNSLNPVYTVGDQITEVLREKRESGLTRKEMRRRIEELFSLVGLDPKRIDSYPHQLSGGMKQRSLIAMALALDPSLIVADEPTTALDVIVQFQILKKISELGEQLGCSMIIITHDAASVAETCDNVAIMYAGMIMEYDISENIFSAPRHPYSKGLINSIPNIKLAEQKMVSIPGSPPSLRKEIQGCPFQPRCEESEAICKEELPASTNTGEDSFYRCHVVAKRSSSG